MMAQAEKIKAWKFRLTGGTGACDRLEHFAKSFIKGLTATASYNPVAGDKDYCLLNLAYKEIEALNASMRNPALTGALSILSGMKEKAAEVCANPAGKQDMVSALCDQADTLSELLLQEARAERLCDLRAGSYIWKED